MLKRGNIPEHAVLVFDGIRCRVYQWPQKMYDGTTATFEKVVRIPAATVIAEMDGRILIQEQEQPHRAPFICLAGGHADAWEESLDDVVKRELKEETGLESNDWQLFADVSQRDFSVFEHHLYLARDCQKVAEPVFDVGEKIKERLVTLKEFREVIEDPLWRHWDITNYLNKPGNFDRLESLIGN